MSLFGTSGIRRIADRTLLEIAFKTGLALGQNYKDIVIARDTRASGNAVKYALLSGLLSTGVTCRDTGIVPTPTLAAAVGDSQIGVMITASHNPPEYNGIKIFNPDGSSFDEKQQAELEKIINSVPATTAWHEMRTDCLPYPDAIENHISRILKYVSPVPSMKVAIDAGCGAASVITPLLLRRLGCEVITLNCNPSGFFPHNIEPTKSNLTDLIRICQQMEVIGIAHDGDADRMMAVDEKGRFIPGDKLMILLARQLQAQEIVTTVDTSMVVQELGFHTTRTKVGDTYVSERLRKGGEFGGESSGAWIFPASSLCPDGIFAAALIVSLASQNRLSSLVDDIPQYPILRGSIPHRGIDFNKVVSSLASMEVHSTDNSDGCKLIFNDGWLLCRPSGTEPLIRLTAEAKTEKRVHEIYDKAVTIIKNINPVTGKN
jgi:phosphoglucosamine mutase